MKKRKIFWFYEKIPVWNKDNSSFYNLVLGVDMSHEMANEIDSMILNKALQLGNEKKDT